VTATAPWAFSAHERELDGRRGCNLQVEDPHARFREALHQRALQFQAARARIPAEYQRDRPHGVELGDHAPERNAKSAGNRRVQVTPDHAANTGITDDQAPLTVATAACCAAPRGNSRAARAPRPRPSSTMTVACGCSCSAEAGHHGAQRSFHHARNGVRLGGAVGDQQAMPRLQDGSDSHGDHVERDLSATECRAGWLRG
jgi:hypothetical protein